MVDGRFKPSTLPYNIQSELSIRDEQLLEFLHNSKSLGLSRSSLYEIFYLALANDFIL